MEALCLAEAVLSKIWIAKKNLRSWLHFDDEYLKDLYDSRGGEIY